tara:strand:+ start:303 stop:1472 length:1170 start_codon:yes stop_codon:yes gene_type:complete
MNRQELITRLKEATDEQKDKMLSWLRAGEGHSVMELDYFADRGIPLEMLKPMKKRTWSNFVRVPKGITKVSRDLMNERPIGFVEEDDGWYGEGWFYLPTPQEEEKGYLTIGKSYRDDRTKRVFVEGISEETYEDYDVRDQLIEDNSPHPKASHYSDKWDDCEGGAMTIDYTIPITPEQRDKEDWFIELEKGSDHFLIKYDGQKRVDYISVNKAAWHRNQSQRKPLTKKAAMDWVRERLEESPNISFVIGGSGLNFRKDGKRRPMKDIAQDKCQGDQDNIAWHKRMWKKYNDDCPDLNAFIKDTDDVPSGWSHERFMSLGYTDAMWDNHFMVPWVDGVGSTNVISTIKHTLGVDKPNSMLGRGSAARLEGTHVIEALREEGVLPSEGEEE